MSERTRIALFCDHRQPLSGIVDGFVGHKTELTAGNDSNKFVAVDCGSGEVHVVFFGREEYTKHYPDSKTALIILDLPAHLEAPHAANHRLAEEAGAFDMRLLWHDLPQALARVLSHELNIADREFLWRGGVSDFSSQRRAEPLDNLSGESLQPQPSAIRTAYFHELEARLAAPAVVQGLKPTLAFCSPIYPQEYGVPVYSMCTARELAKYARIDLINTVPPLARDAKVFNAFVASPSSKAIDGYDYKVFVLGNNKSLHSIPVKLVQTVEDGVCIMHDPQMLDVMVESVGLHACAAQARALSGSRFKDSEVQKWLSERDTLPVPLLPDIKESLVTVVHSPTQCATYRRFHPHRKSLYLPHAIQHHVHRDYFTPSWRQALRAGLRIPPDRKVIVTCGAVNASKRCVDALLALCHLHDSGLMAHLYFVGVIEENADEPLRKLAVSLSIDEHVHFTDRIDEETYMHYLFAADCGLQLRLTLFGQLSGAVSDCLAAGLPTVAPQSLMSAIEAPSYGKCVSDQFTSLDVARALSETLSKDDREIDLDEWHTFVDEHSFERYGKRLASAIGL